MCIVIYCHAILCRLKARVGILYDAHFYVIRLFASFIVYCGIFPEALCATAFVRLNPVCVRVVCHLEGSYMVSSMSVGFG